MPKQITVRREPNYRKPHLPGGKGRKLIKTRTPDERKKKYGHKHPMNAMAGKFGYSKATQIPKNTLGIYVKRLVQKYGEQSVRGMIRAQINFRVNSKNKKVKQDKEKFEAMMASLDQQFKGGGWQ